MVTAVKDLMSAQNDVKVDSAVIKRIYDTQGTLLNVLA